jgi:hypothetical protein
MAYGQYCLQEDEHKSAVGDAGRDLVRQLVCIAQGDDKQISTKERLMIETVAVNYGISSVDIDKIIAELN